MKKQLTAEQQAKRAQFKALWKQVGAMDEATREIECARLGYVNTEGRAFSGRNSMLLALQGGGTVFGGFRQWLAMGRAVRKGEHGKMIWVPCGKKAESTEGESEAGGDTFFIIGTVFDIGQTDEVATDATVSAEMEVAA